MKNIKVVLLLVSLLLGTGSAVAHDFSATVGNQRLFFNITDTVSPSAMVTYKGSIAEGSVPEVSGEIDIPSKVKNGNVVYTVTAIGSKAFSGAVDLTGVIIPSTINHIGDFAFEGCSSLEKVVFPGTQLKMGQGVFFKCTSIKDISFGSDWSIVDLTPYRWSDSLRSVSIPAKVAKIQNMKSVHSLQSIIVDSNNSRFSSYDGVLYNKEGTTLYGVPRAYEGKLTIKEGTTTITNGALIDCPLITCIDVPSSVTTLSFRETSRMYNLSEIIFRAEKPIATAYLDGDGIFLLQVANPNVKITVGKESKKTYVAELTITPGEFCESDEEGQVPYVVAEGQLPSIKNINGVKDIENYEKD